MQRQWCRRGLVATLLLPLAGLFAALVFFRRQAYRRGWLKSVRLPVPVVVIGNISVGGTGKTPLTVWLARRLRALGRHPAIVSRGYRGSGAVQPVDDQSQPAEVGDEALLLFRQSGCPVYVGRDRVAAARALLAAHPEIDLVLCDDGLQHYRLGRDVELALIDSRGLMNGWPLPAGPLREPASRLRQVDALIVHGERGDGDFRMRLCGTCFYRLDAPECVASADELRPLRLHAVAGIGDPARFFTHLAALGLDFVAHAFADHHVYRAAELDFAGDAILTTEKDAVKLSALPPELRLPVWVLPVVAEVEPDLARFVLAKIMDRPVARPRRLQVAAGRNE